MCQYADGGEVVAKRGAVCDGIDAGGESADDGCRTSF